MFFILTLHFQYLMQLFSLSEIDIGHTQARDFFDDLGDILFFLCMGNNQCKNRGVLGVFCFKRIWII